jgi:mono/diheme cytochrome c family protein
MMATAARADEHRVGRAMPLPVYTQECASCHIAFPPRLLPAASWQRVTENLSRHYGSDAAIDVATARVLSTWLQANAATGKRAVPPPEDRITRAAWFQREHDEVPAATWALQAVKSPANCAACHTQAEQGDFSERHIRIPR